jgi:hypothetical protein
MGRWRDSRCWRFCPKTFRRNDLHDLKILGDRQGQTLNINFPKVNIQSLTLAVPPWRSWRSDREIENFLRMIDAPNAINSLEF